MFFAVAEGFGGLSFLFWSFCFLFLLLFLLLLLLLLLLFVVFLLLLVLLLLFFCLGPLARDVTVVLGCGTAAVVVLGLGGVPSVVVDAAVILAWVEEVTTVASLSPCGWMVVAEREDVVVVVVATGVGVDVAVVVAVVVVVVVAVVGEGELPLFFFCGG